jgi:hypothetical protein
MIVHVAAFRWLDSVTADVAAEALEGIRAIAGEVAGVIDISCGTSYSPYSRGLTHAILVRAESQEALDAYRAHPNHLAAGSKMDLSQVVDQNNQPGIVVDFVA